MHNRPARDVTGSTEFGVFLNSLPANDPFRTELQEAFVILREDLTRGEKIQRNLWPEIYVQQYGINNLWWFPLREGARLVYTLLGDFDGITVSVLEAFSTHQEYEERFGY